MTTPSEKLAESLKVLHGLQNEWGIAIVKGDELIEKIQRGDWSPGRDGGHFKIF